MRSRSEIFPRVSRLAKGYACKQVDVLLRAIDATLEGREPRVTPGDIRRAGFELVRGGYDVRAVDTALDKLEERVLAQSMRELAGSPQVGWELDVLRRELGAPPGLRFPRARGLRSGHDVDEVDALVTRISTALHGGPAVRVSELRAATFRRQRRGYDEDAVDQMLDRLIELLLVMDDAAATKTPARAPAAAEVSGPARERRSGGRRS